MCKTEKETQMYRTDFWILWEKARVGCSERIALKQVYYQGWNRSPAQVGCMWQVLWAGALGSHRRMGWGGRREGGSRWGTHVNPWLIHVNIWQKLLQYCKVINLQLIIINEKKEKEHSLTSYTKINSKWIKTLNVRLDTIELFLLLFFICSEFCHTLEWNSMGLHVFPIGQNIL